MPINSNNHAYSGNTHSYADKYQSIAPENNASQGSWLKPSGSQSSAPLLDQQPTSALSPNRQKKLEALKKNKDKLENLPATFPTPALPASSFQPAINLTQKRIDQLSNPPKTSNPITKFNNAREVKQTDNALNKEMASLYKQARDVQTNGTNPTDKNRASNVTDELTVMGRDQSWLKDVRKENRKGNS
ncbi:MULTISPECIES: hypothetical protein [Pseudomonas]|uniref:Uncharacterized protein n=1 Tax=Pseudomonas fluorescens LMG 5329 TaxID=1324332 RepID=A0A0A1YZS3_PSEFL|nr:MULTISPECIES: hypothetical protein [Pseudomonas]KGE66311.1 hypothetical protein K814_0119395 [Pseudomonas fluorescens LMG 5329]NWC73120.1 hypothetical protein [Pseudomonas sp. P7759]NWE01951.1 hypothetical protein [Pseudomonas sp. IPO3749]NWF22152.1 hypothetical protein [Pseudomonas sp. IPO3749]